MKLFKEHHRYFVLVSSKYDTLDDYINWFEKPALEILQRAKMKDGALSNMVSITGTCNVYSYTLFEAIQCCLNVFIIIFYLPVYIYS